MSFKDGGCGGAIKFPHAEIGELADIRFSPANHGAAAEKNCFSLPSQIACYEAQQINVGR
jgi:hypothetical protein